MFYALSNLVTGQAPTWRQLSGPKDQLNPGEVLWQGMPPTNPVWDATLKGGAGDLRQATSTELLAQVAPETNALQALQAFASSQPQTPEGKAIVAIMVLLGIATPAPASTSPTVTLAPSVG